ncbi:MAG: hypothetical protein CW341_07980 [Bacteroidetes bacterium]|nr:hypothetical protein [Bacteroidota bacterium]
MVNASILLKYKYLQKNTLFRWDIKKIIFALVEMFAGANNYLLLQTQTDLNQDFTHSAWHL